MLGVSRQLVSDWFAGRKTPTLEQRLAILDLLKKKAQGDGIRPIELVPFKIGNPAKQVRYARLCSFFVKGRSAISTQPAGINSKASARSAARPARSATASRKRLGRGMGRNHRWHRALWGQSPDAEKPARPGLH